MQGWWLHNHFSASLDVLVDDARATANINLQKAAWAADEALEQTVQGHHGPPVVGLTITDLGHADSLPPPTPPPPFLLPPHHHHHQAFGFHRSTFVLTFPGNSSGCHERPRCCRQEVAGATAPLMGQT